MNWIGSIGTSIVCAAIGAVGYGYLAWKCIDWFDISSRDGGAGYLILAWGLAGMLASGGIGFFVSVVVQGGFLRGFSMTLAIVAGIFLAIYGIARTVGDVPPTLAGRELLLEMEFQMPPGWTPPESSKNHGGNAITLASVTPGRVRRATRIGWLYVEKARIENDLTIIPAVTGLFTDKGSREVTLTIGNQIQPFGFVIPVPPSPGPQFLTWSEWLPRKSADVRFRFRVVPVKD